VRVLSSLTKYSKMMHFTNKFILENDNKYENEDIPVVLRFHQKTKKT
jgi:hypothetical protein